MSAFNNKPNAQQFETVLKRLVLKNLKMLTAWQIIVIFWLHLHSLRQLTWHMKPKLKIYYLTTTSVIGY